jgi:hypothetical protein
MRLLRKYRGTLLLTPRGRSVRDNPLALWWQLAAMMPLPSAQEYETDAGMLLLVAMAAAADNVPATASDLLSMLGWAHANGEPLSDWAASSAAWDTDAVLRRLGCYVQEDRVFRSDKPTPHGVQFARAALRTWPDEAVTRRRT